MRNFFKKQPSPTVEKEIEVGEVYSDIIQQIHNEFANAGNLLLDEAQSILNNIDTPSEKTIQLERFGFKSTKEVLRKSRDEEKLKTNESILSAVREANTAYPLYKWITIDMADKIAKKYNLIIGDVSQYKGFVPEKNVKDIERFFMNHDSDRYVYFYTSFMSNTKCTKEEYDIALKNQHKAHREGFLYMNTVGKTNVTLHIAAPLKDMNMEGYELRGRMAFKKEIPDPIVFLRRDFSGVKGYIIITAWGDEASDPEIINNNLN